MVSDNNTDVFKMFDGDNYPMWAYMMQHVLVSKSVWNIVQGIDVRPGSMDTGDVEDATGFVAGIATIRVVLPTAKQAHWDVRDV